MSERMDEKHPPDEGCSQATELVGYQSKCTECPFYPSECVLDTKRANPIHKEIVGYLGRPKQLSVAKIASLVGVTPRTVYTIMSRVRQK